ncbi:hypothetical protein HT576_18575 [Haloterrigena sp. SYSU A121-1]|uniref:Uncharacterized protein n=1 Tax=Haloterrigena gelatinilytica TaxID=2741724 RepID=A0A8J8GPS4_9EURY|nr:hypothetical protein [Haloterrigena gelatinilytica]NUB93015.1 hypothetical protein [Haloterrigena gelatinilytica]
MSGRERTDESAGDEAIGTATDGPNDLDAETVAVAREELQRTFDYQVERLQEIDAKAIEILKANLLLIGLVVTGGSIVFQTDIHIMAFANLFTIAGGVLLLVSTGLAGVTYTASNLRGGVDTDAVEVALASARADPETRAGTAQFEERLLRSYGRWIEYNARVTAVNDMFATITVLMVIASLVYVTAGIAVGAAGTSRIVSMLSFLVLTAVLAWLGAFAYYMDHLGVSEESWEGTFDGVRLSKGVTRKRGLSTLRTMRSERDEAEADEAEAGADEAEADGAKARTNPLD